MRKSPTCQFKAPATTSLDECVRQALIHQFPQRSEAISRSKVRRLIMAGQVSVLGQAMRLPAFVVSKGMAVSIHLDETRFFAQRDPGDQHFSMDATHIVYDDGDILAVNKPAGLPCDSTMLASRDHLLAAVRRYREGRDEGGEIFLQHRLDRDTSGLVLFGLKAELNAALHQCFAQRQARKTYWAIVTGQPPTCSNFDVHNRLDRISAKSSAARYGAVTEGGQEAHTSFRLLQQGRRACLVEACPHTGRSHQIRVHLAGLGLPILGDTLYGGNSTLGSMAVQRSMLHALVLELPHPRTAAALRLEAPLPPDFQACLELL